MTMNRLTLFLLTLLCPAMFSHGQQWSGCPIVIDLEGKSFDGAFTDVQHGVAFDYVHAGDPVQIAWTEPGRNIGFLVLNRHGDQSPGKDEHLNVLTFFKIREEWKKQAASGTTPGGEPATFHVASSREMFGGLTNQPLSQQEADIELAKNPPEPHRSDGFHALSFFDRTENGGNGNGVIDAGDLVFSHLRVWVDTAHNGRSEDGRMYSLPELGIQYISLNYTSTERVDRYGNKTQQLGKVGMVNAVQTPFAIYDVCLRLRRNPPGSH